MIKQRTKEWHDQRVGMITGSNVGAILGLDPHKTAEDVLRQMVRDYYGEPREFTGNTATEWGTFNEKTALEQFEMCRNITVVECGFFVSPAYPWLGASPDGLIGSHGVLEIKCPYGLRDAKAPVQFKQIHEQPHYYAQVQIEMLVTNRLFCKFYQWSPNGDQLEIVRNDAKWIKENLPKLEQFKDRYLWERENPARHLEPKQ